MSDVIPATERLTIDLRPIEDDDDRREYANEQIDAFAADLTDRGLRVAFEVWYLGIRDPETGELRDTSEADFDVLELVDGQLVTMGPYPDGWTR